MALVRWRPMQELDVLRRQMDRLFDEFLRGDRESLSLFGNGRGEWEPAIELKETDQEILLKAEIPGVESKDLDIEVSEDAVSIAGEHREESKTEEKGMLRSEFHYGRFQRVIPLPTTVQHEGVKSTFKDGVLTLTLPKAEGTRRTVKVKVE